MLRSSSVAAFAVILLAIPAAASAPVRCPLDFTSGPFPLRSLRVVRCTGTRSVPGAQLVWFDANGQPIKVTFTNSETEQMLTGFSKLRKA